MYTQIDDSASKSFLGFIVAAFSFGQLMTSPLIGMWSNYRPIKEPLIITLVVTTCGYLLYSYAEAFDCGGKWVLIGSRFIMGLGAGTCVCCVHVCLYVRVRMHACVCMCVRARVCVYTQNAHIAFELRKQLIMYKLCILISHMLMYVYSFMYCYMYMYKSYHVKQWAEQYLHSIVYVINIITMLIYICM